MYAAMLWRIIPGTKFTPNLYLSVPCHETTTVENGTKDSIHSCARFDETRKREEKRKKGGEKEGGRRAGGKAALLSRRKFVRRENFPKDSIELSRSTIESSDEGNSEEEARRNRARKHVSPFHECLLCLRVSVILSRISSSSSAVPPFLLHSYHPATPTNSARASTNKGEGGIMNVEKGRRAGSSFRDETVGQLAISVSRTLRIFTLGISVSDLGYLIDTCQVGEFC